MLKDFAWSTFIKTGNIDAYVFYKEMEQNSNIAVESKKIEEEAISS